MHGSLLRDMFLKLALGFTPMIQASTIILKTFCEFYGINLKYGHATRS